MRNNGPVTQREYMLPPGTTLVSTTDLQSHITYCNPAFVETSGFSRDELIGSRTTWCATPTCRPRPTATCGPRCRSASPGRRW